MADLTDGAEPPRRPKLRKDGEIDGRGHAEGSKGTRFSHEDGRKRPGRPKGAISMKTAYTLAAAMPVEVIDKRTGQKRRLSTPQGIALKQRELALKGDPVATRRFEGHIAEYCPEEVDPMSTAKLLDEDRILLDLAAARGLIPAPPVVPDADPDE